MFADVNGIGLPAGCRKALESMSAELNGINPSFTIRRNIQQALDDRVMVDELRKVTFNSLLTTDVEQLLYWKMNLFVLY